jgi:hypothetical protein
MAIYASVRIPEVWRYYKKTIQVYQLTSEGKYKIRASSLVGEQLKSWWNFCTQVSVSTSCKKIHQGDA